MFRKLIALTALGIGVVITLNSFSAAPLAMAAQNKDEKGKKLFMTYCASCHGTDGKGGGPVASSLKTLLPDLTNIRKDDKGKFPALHVRNTISGEFGVGAHGSREMPVWGTYFKLKIGGSVSRLNVYALTKYVESIQQK